MKHDQVIVRVKDANQTEPCQVAWGPILPLITPSPYDFQVQRSTRSQFSCVTLRSASSS